MLAHAERRVEQYQTDHADSKRADHADSRRANRVELHQADLAEPLDFADDGEFDAVLGALVPGYVEDWRPTFAEFARVPTPGGVLVFSVGHPIEDFCDDAGAENYLEAERLVEVPYYRRPLAEAGFRLDEIAEP